MRLPLPDRKQNAAVRVGGPAAAAQQFI